MDLAPRAPRGLTGWVQNGDDGAVEAAFRGAPRAVEDMLELCRGDSSKMVVDDVLVEPWKEPTADGCQVRP